MDRIMAARAGSKATVAAVAACLALAIGAAPAGALPSLGGLLRAPVAGLHVDLGCANPANHDVVGQVLGAVRTAVGGQLRCFSKAIASNRGLGPQVMAGPTGLGPKQIQAAYKLSGLSSGGRTVAIVDAYDDPRAESDLAKFRKHLRALRVYFGQRLLQEDQPERRGESAARRRLRLVGGDQPRPRCCVLGVPRLPHRARRGQLREHP
jgi:hypothetical protein